MFKRNILPFYSQRVPKSRSTEGNSVLYLSDIRMTSDEFFYLKILLHSFFSCCPRSTDRVVAVSGSSEVVLNAVKQVVALASDVSVLK